MKKNIFILLAFLCSITVFGQNRKVDKSIEKAIEANEIIIEDLKDTVAVLNSQCGKLDSIIQGISTRQFPRTLSEVELAKELEKLTIKGIWMNQNNIHAKLKLAKNTETAKYYFQIIEIYESLNRPYNEEVNEKYIKLLDTDDMKWLPIHGDNIKILSSSVKDYRFVMFELARVFKIIDGLEGNPEAIKNRLNESDELEFITDDIPYAYRCVERYINLKATPNDKIKKELLEELKQSCLDAFSDF